MHPHRIRKCEQGIYEGRRYIRYNCKREDLGVRYSADMNVSEQCANIKTRRKQN